MSTAPADPFGPRVRPVRVLFAAPDRLWDAYRDLLPRALAEAGVLATVEREIDPAEVDWIVHAPGGPVTDFSPYTRAKAVLSLWAGVEGIITNPTLTQPLARMVDPGLRQGMVEWVTAHVLRHHLNLDRHIRRSEPLWQPEPPPLAPERPVTVLGLGELGLACALALAGLGFPVTGWARSPKEEPRLRRVFTGLDGLAPALAGAQIVVLLTPLTRHTENLMNAERLRIPARGYALLNPGRAGSSTTRRCWPRWTRGRWVMPRSTSSGRSRCPPIIPSGAIRASPSPRMSPPRRAPKQPCAPWPRMSGGARPVCRCSIWWIAAPVTEAGRRQLTAPCRQETGTLQEHHGPDPASEAPDPCRSSPP
ncbi:Phosphoglycerate dehydrogenase [Rubellimicrobium thermophilum DSM 16684]|uniref:Phosphoglycerate dehydrogenase n=1 Tax=Rubellimicrobium thermophilum DSM 16684 TaxID=1123069 RepID=S9R453_9RHOB|nr:Phosphoglycerate dehydrogenase [Rubellimicrobium thermophilum DSM 16684]